MNGLQSQGLFLDNMLAFGLASLLKYEAMHNLDFGLTQDLLQSIEHFFAVHEGQATATSITESAKDWQSALPRRSVTDGTFRLPSIGLMISKTHANVNTAQLRSSLCVIPFMLQ